MTLSTAADPQRRGAGLRGLAELVGTVAVAIGVALLVQAFLVKPYKIPSSSMFPTLHVNQRILVNRLATHPGVGDIVVFHPPAGADNDNSGSQCGDPDQGPGHSQPCDTPTRRASGQAYVKRVVGLPGNTLAIHNGYVSRNGVKETGAYIQPCPEPAVCAFSQTITVPKGDYYMMGDNRGDSDDSRFWGPVPQGWIIGTRSSPTGRRTASARSEHPSRHSRKPPRSASPSRQQPCGRVEPRRGLPDAGDS